MYHSEIFPALRALSISVERVGEVLEEMGVLVDDRRTSFEGWLERKLDGLTPNIRDAVEIWLRTMRDGGPRSTAHDIASVWNRMNNLRPTLLDWSARYDHLREITRDDVLAVLDELHGSRRSNVLGSLRSLFAFCQKKRLIFRNPTRGIRVGQHPYGIAQPLDQGEVDHAVEIAKTPVARLVLVLAGVHAARTSAIIAPCGSSRTSTSATGDSPSPAGSARSTSSPTRSCANGSTTDAPAGPAPRTPT